MIVGVKRLIAWLDRLLLAAGQRCCAARSQRGLDRTLGRVRR
jgi:hypothetical protein